jgi:serine protease Do
MTQPVQAVPSFADVIDRVKPAVVSVRVKVQNVQARADGGSNRGSDGQQFSMPDLPPGHPLERFFRQFREQQEGQQRNERGGRPGPRQFGQSQGSGFFISADGYLVTNNHVVANAAEVQIVMDDGRTLDAKVVGTDPRPTSRSSRSMATGTSRMSVWRPKRLGLAIGCWRSETRLASAAR